MALFNSIASKSNKVIRMSPSIELTPETASSLIFKYQDRLTEYNILQEYYEGYHSILARQMDAGKPNNRLVHNFASYITDIRTGYFTGLPITYECEDTLFQKEIQAILDDNSEPDITSELDKISNIKGHSFELYWIDEEAKLKFKQLQPEEVLMVYSTELSERPLYAIRYYTETNPIDDSSFIQVYLYDSEFVQEFTITVIDNTTTPKKFTVSDPFVYPHNIGQLPVLEYVNNTERMSSFEDVISLIDAYNKTESDTVNEVEYFNDAYLLIKNMGGTDESDVSDLRENRILLVEGDGDAKFLTKDANGVFTDNTKDRIAKDIHKFSKTPNLVSDEFISNLSGTAIRYKVWGLEQDCAKKERKWQKVLHSRLQIMANYLAKFGIGGDIDTFKLTFNRNLPQNIMELGQMVSQLKGTVSQETLLSQMPFIDNVNEELLKLQADFERSLSQQQATLEMQQTVEPSNDTDEDNV